MRSARQRLAETATEPGFARTQNKVVLRDLAVPDLLWESILTIVNISVEPQTAELRSNLGRIVFLRVRIADEGGV